MRMCKKFVLLGVLVIGIASAGVIAQEREGIIYEWSTNIEEAVEEAGQEDKYVFVYFAGSDWCPYCMDFEANVIDAPTFQRYLRENFVPVLIDSPRYLEISEEQKAYNQEQLATYDVRGFPAIGVFSGTGEPLVLTGYNRNGVHAFTRYLKQVIRTDQEAQETPSEEG